jgi:hypothetical protein
LFLDLITETLASKDVRVFCLTNSIAAFQEQLKENLTFILLRPKIIIVVLSHFISGILFSQSDSLSKSDTLNKFNVEGRKTGYWKVYLDEHVNPVKSDTSACFYAYNLYDNGSPVFVFSRTKMKAKSRQVYSDSLPQRGSPKLLAGTFKWYVGNGNEFEEIYDRGCVQYIRGYSKQGNQEPALIWEYDYTKRYNHTLGSALYTEYSSDGKKKEYWYKKGKNGWRIYPKSPDRYIYTRIKLDVDIIDEADSCYLIVVRPSNSVLPVYKERYDRFGLRNIDSVPDGAYVLEILDSCHMDVPLLTKYFSVVKGKATVVTISLSHEVSYNTVDSIRNITYEHEKGSMDLNLFYLPGNPPEIPGYWNYFTGVSLTGGYWLPFSRHMGAQWGGGLGLSHYAFKNDTTFMTNFLLTKKYESYNYIDLHLDFKFRFTSGNQKKGNGSWPGIVLDVGTKYYFPILFRHIAVYENSKKVINKHIHQFTDLRAYASFGISPVTFFYEQNLSDFIIGNYPELPKFRMGLRIFIY